MSLLAAYLSLPINEFHLHESFPAGFQLSLSLPPHSAIVFVSASTPDLFGYVLLTWSTEKTKFYVKLLSTCGWHIFPIRRARYSLLISFAYILSLM